MGSTFKGRIPHTPFCIDDFSPSQLQSFLTSPLSATCNLIFLLSHLHGDHIRGLSSSWHHGTILTSAVTRRLLIARLGLPPDLVRAVPYNTPTELLLSPHLPLTFTLTLLPVIHCPGAAMFVLDGYFGRIVYTGDLRMRGQLPRMLTEAPVDVLYLDDTFAGVEGGFLSRADCVRAILRLMRLPAHAGCRFVMNADLLGKEDVAVLVAMRMQCLVSVEEDKYSALAALWDAQFDLNDLSDRPPQPSSTYALSARCADGGANAEEESDDECERLDTAALSYPTWLSFFTTNSGETLLHLLPKRLLTRDYVHSLNSQRTVGSRSARPRTVGIYISGFASLSPSSAADCSSCEGCVHPVRYSSHCAKAELEALVAAIRPAAVRPISTGGSGEWYRQWVQPEDEREIVVPKELTEGLWRAVDGAGSTARSRGVRRRRSDALAGCDSARRRGLLLEPRSSQSDDDVNEEADPVRDDSDVREEIRVDDSGITLEDDDDGEVDLTEPTPPTASGREKEREAVRSSVAATPVSLVGVDEQVRYFSLPCDRSRLRFLPRLSLSVFEPFVTPPLPPSPRKLPAFLVRSEASGGLPQRRTLSSPASPDRAVAAPAPSVNKRRALSGGRRSLPLSWIPSASLRYALGAGALTPLGSTSSPSLSGVPSSTSSVPSPSTSALSAVDALTFPPHAFPRLRLSAIPAQHLDVVDDKENQHSPELFTEAVRCAADAPLPPHLPLSSAPAALSSPVSVAPVPSVASLKEILQRCATGRST